MNSSIKDYYEITGEGEPLLLISGLNADRFFWTSTIPYLKKNFSVITYDNRGMGKNKLFEPECTTELMANDLINLLDHLKIKKTHIVGHSLGGCIAQQIAIHHPDRVNKLVLCSSQAKLLSLRKFSIKTNIELMKSDVPPEIIIKNMMSWLFGHTFLDDPKKQTLFIRQALMKPFEESRYSYLYQVNALLNHDTSNQLNKITCPTLAICGEEDILSPPTNSQYLADNISAAKLFIFENAGHMLPVEDPEGFSRCIIEFLA